MPKKLYAIVGDYYHEPTIIRDALQQSLGQPGGHYDVEFIDEHDLTAALNDDPAGVIFFKEDRVNPETEDEFHWMKDDIQEEIDRYVRQGGGWLAWHSGMASFPTDGAYVSMLGGYFLRHPREHQVVIYAPRESHELGSGMATFAFADEHYFMHHDTDAVDVFLTSSSVDGDSVAGWTKLHGNGKVCCLTPAHMLEGLNDPEFQKVLRRAVEFVTG